MKSLVSGSVFDYAKPEWTLRIANTSIMSICKLMLLYRKIVYSMPVLAHVSAAES